MENIIKKAFEYAIAEGIIEKGSFLEVSKSDECDLDCAFYIDTDYITYTNHTPNDKTYVAGEWEIHTKESLINYINDRILDSLYTIFCIPEQWHYFDHENAFDICHLVLESESENPFENLSEEFIKSFNVKKLVEDGNKYTLALDAVGFIYKSYYLFRVG